QPALVAFAALAGTASAMTAPTALESRLASYPVEINVNDLSKSELARVNIVLSSGDSQAEIVRRLQSIAK
ncbi:hypothetical protein, partial [Actibacterium sp. 188UL27-1]|uniref:hypothetical protein n=1 Tax=Actibacterium sp. 188UL27-1 TaxID=2786961 RepID=UPI00195D6B64